MSSAARILLSTAVALALTTQASAQQAPTVQIVNGRATVRAQNVPLRAILNEWARVGNTNVVGADRTPAGAVTIELVDVPERQALDTLLRNVSGYMLAMRPVGTDGASVYNRILIMPPSTAPRALPTPAPGLAVRQPPVADTDNDQPGGDNNARTAPAVRAPQVGGPNVPPAPAEETAQPAPPQTPAVVVTPGNPFGLPVGSSSTPGVISPPAPAPQPRQEQN